MITRLKRYLLGQEGLLRHIADQEETLEDVVAQLGAVVKQLEMARTIPSTPLALRRSAVEAAVEYILSEDRFANVQASPSNNTALMAGLQATAIDGTVAEFGVYRGTSLTTIARHFPDKTVHGFDSFEGLPEAWGGTNKGKGAFDIGGRPPELPVDNTRFHIGFFEQTVPAFASSERGPFSFVHLDADLYSSTAQVFEDLQAWFVPGTVIVFDEYFGYHGWQLHEHKAFTEFLDASRLDYEALAIGHMNLTVRLIA